MPRPKSPCGTYSAYQRHLRERTPVDAACKRAQRERDASRSVRQRADDVSTRVAAAPASLPGISAREVEIRDMYVKCAVDLAEFAANDYLEGVVDLKEEMDQLLDEWIDLQDSPEEVRG